jgi:hypothetical protein
MEGKERSKSRRKRMTQAIGAGAALLVIAGAVGMPYGILAAMALSATLVLIVDP